MAARQFFTIDAEQESPKLPRLGWFIIPGLQGGLRTFADQAAGLQPVFDSCAGKSVLDLGCAEGLIGIECARRGARFVRGIEGNGQHAAVARVLAAGLPVEIMDANMRLVTLVKSDRTFDIVLALGIISKMPDTVAGMRWACRTCDDVLAFRGGSRYQAGVLGSKRLDGMPADVRAIMRDEGFTLQADGKDARNFNGETVELWQRRVPRT